MPYITSVERIGMQRGAVRTWRQAIADALATRFETNVPQSVMSSLDKVEDLDALKALFKQAIAVGSLEEFQRLLAT